MDRWMNGQRDEQMGRWVHGWKEKWVDELMYRLGVDGWMNEWTDRYVDGK